MVDLKIDAPVSLRARLIHYSWRVRKKLGLVIQNDIPGHFSAAGGTYLHGLASRLMPGQRVVEIGAFLGRSTTYIASALPVGVEFYTIDLWKPDLPAESGPPAVTEETFEQFQNNIAAWKDKVFVQRGDSKEIGRLWDKGLIDLCIIDADHSYEGVKKDIMVWLPHITPGGRMCFHDYTQPTCGVKQAVDEVLSPVGTDLLLVQTILSMRVRVARESE